MRLIKKSYNNYSDEDLMNYLSKGDKYAFDELYERYSQALFVYFKRHLWQDTEKAEDFVQDLFTKIIKKPESFDTQRNFKTWLYSVANNMCKNEYKKHEVRKNTNHSTEESYHVKDEQTDVFAEVYENEFMGVFEQKLAVLDNKHKEVFSLRHFDGLSIKEIADMLNINEGTIKSRLFYATKQLGELLKEYNPLVNR